MRFAFLVLLCAACRSNPEEPAHPPQTDAQLAWVGTHTFVATGAAGKDRPTPTVEYQLRIDRSANGYLVHIAADGAQTMIRMVGRGASSGDKLTVSYESCEAEDMFGCKPYAAGDILFTLTGNEGVTKMHFAAMTAPSGTGGELTEKAL